MAGVLLMPIFDEVLSDKRHGGSSSEVAPLE
jgi:hypothetical protein